VALLRKLKHWSWSQTLLDAYSWSLKFGFLLYSHGFKLRWPWIQNARFNSNSI